MKTGKLLKLMSLGLGAATFGALSNGNSVHAATVNTNQNNLFSVQNYGTLQIQKVTDSEGEVNNQANSVSNETKQSPDTKNVIADTIANQQTNQATSSSVATQSNVTNNINENSSQQPLFSVHNYQTLQNNSVQNTTKENIAATSSTKQIQSSTSKRITTVQDGTSEINLIPNLNETGNLTWQSGTTRTITLNNTDQVQVTQVGSFDNLNSTLQRIMQPNSNQKNATATTVTLTYKTYSTNNGHYQAGDEVGKIQLDYSFNPQSSVQVIANQLMPSGYQITRLPISLPCALNFANGHLYLGTTVYVASTN